MQQTSFLKRLLRIIKRVIIVMIFAGIFFGLLWFGNKITKIQTIVIKGDSRQQLRGLDRYYQKNLALLFTKGIEQSVLADNPQLQSVSIEKKFPNTLVITIQAQTVVASLAMNEGYTYLSEEGKIVQKNREPNNQLPVIHYYQKLIYSSVSAGDDLKHIDIISALHFIKKCSELGLKTDTVDINGVDMLLFTIGDKKIYFTTEKDIKTQDYELEQIIKRFKIEGKDFKSLDLRFEKPIIKF